MSGDRDSRETVTPLARLGAALQAAAAIAVVAFGTCLLFRGNLEGAFSTFPLLLVWYLFLNYGKRRRN